jgi:hypothetical protein
MPRSLASDYHFGRRQETLVLPRIRQYFDDTIEADENVYSRADFNGQKFKYELKSRTNTYSAFPTTLLPEDKVFTENQVFLFNFTDGLYYIKYDKDVFDTFEKKMFRRRQRSDHNDVEKMYYYIPITALTHIDC